MVYYGAKELAVGSRTVRNNTILIAKDIPEDKYGFKAAPECRSVAQLLTHIAVCTDSNISSMPWRSACPWKGWISCP